MPVSSENLIWIDLEMTGLQPEKCVIIASLVTDSNLEILAEGPNHVLYATEDELLTLSDWSRDHFGKAGVLDEVRATDVTRAQAEQETLDFLRQWCEPRTSPLCGNSVHHDRAFLYHGMRDLHDFAHYRNIDVSTFKELFHRWYPGRVHPPEKAQSHRALADIRETVFELRYYRDTFIHPPE